MADTNQKLLTVRMEESFLQQLRVATVAKETTIAAVVRQALQDWLSKNGRGSGSASRGSKAKAKPAARTAKPKGRATAAGARKKK